MERKCVRQGVKSQLSRNNPMSSLALATVPDDDFDVGGELTSKLWYSKSEMHHCILPIGKKASIPRREGRIGVSCPAKIDLFE